MPKKEKKWFGITRSTEEDLALVEMILSSRRITLKRITAIMTMSVIILMVYVLMNHALYPRYPVVTSNAEENEIFARVYPPFRMFEWANYSMTEDILHGRLYAEGSLSRLHPVGYPLLAAPLKAKWGIRGMFYANAIILWLTALVFFFLMLELVEFPLAVAATVILALGTPNLFYAASAFSEPSGQLIAVLSFYLFIKGLLSQREWIYYLLCGLVTGLHFFFQPMMAFMIILFGGIVLYERGKFSLSDKNNLSLWSGFLLPLVFFLTVNRLFLGEFGMFVTTVPECIYDLTNIRIYGEESNIITGLWMLLFDSPHGLLFLMPVTMLVPMGIIVMWRNEMRPVTVIVGVTLLYVIVLTASDPCPVTGESVGSRQLVPVIPLLVLPLAFMWREQTAEKIWLAVTLLLTVYMCSFGWWAGVDRGKGLFVGVLQDRNARYIILARKNDLERPEFQSSSKLVALYTASLADRDMKLWLQTLDRDVLYKIKGRERRVFSELCRNYTPGISDTGVLIESVDPDKGVRPVLPDFPPYEGLSPP